MDDLPIFGKMDAAKANLRAAIRAHFERAHPVSIETMNAAANGILRNLAKAKGISGVIHDSEFFEGKEKKAWGDLLHESQNFYKHADRGSEEKTHVHNPLITQLLMLESCQFLRHLAGSYENFKDETELQVFEIWFLLKNPDLFGGDTTFVNHHPFGADLKALEIDDFPAWINFIDSRRF